MTIGDGARVRKINIAQVGLIEECARAKGCVRGLFVTDLIGASVHNASRRMKANANSFGHDAEETCKLRSDTIPSRRHPHDRVLLMFSFGAGKKQISLKFNF